MISRDADPADLIRLCNLPSKADAERYCRSLTIRQRDFVCFVMYGIGGVLNNYKYASFFQDRIPSHLVPTDDERSALAANGLGPLQGKAKKTLNQMGEILRQRKHLAAHLFYTPSGRHWSLFYLSFREVRAVGNHWAHGPHLHFASSIWIPLDAGEVYDQVRQGKRDFPSLHVRYQVG